MKKIRIILLLMSALYFLAACYNIEITKNEENAGDMEEDIMLSYGAVVGLENEDGTIQKAIVIDFSLPEEKQQYVFVTLYPGDFGQTIFADLSNIDTYACLPEQIVEVYYAGKDNGEDFDSKHTSEFNILPVGSTVRSKNLDQIAGIENGLYVIVGRQSFIETKNLRLYDYIVKKYPVHRTVEYYVLNNEI